MGRTIQLTNDPLSVAQPPSAVSFDPSNTGEGACHKPVPSNTGEGACHKPVIFGLIQTEKSETPNPTAACSSSPAPRSYTATNRARPSLAPGSSTRRLPPPAGTHGSCRNGKHPRHRSQLRLERHTCGKRETGGDPC